MEAFRGEIVCPNKYKEDPLKMYNGHLIETETYIGGHVEALNSGVFRDDFMCVAVCAYGGVYTACDARIQHMSMYFFTWCESLLFRVKAAVLRLT